MRYKGCTILVSGYTTDSFVTVFGKRRRAIKMLVGVSGRLLKPPAQTPFLTSVEAAKNWISEHA
jgi:hypothetical protein